MIKLSTVTTFQIIRENDGSRRVKEVTGDRVSNLQGFQMKMLAAVPGVSKNKRRYSREVLEASVPYWKSAPFIMDHKVDNSPGVLGICDDAYYGTDTLPSGMEKEGLWLHTIGLAEPEMFEKMKGRAAEGIPPLIRNVSIGGEGEGQYMPDGTMDIASFIPDEVSLTPFPGIPEAQIISIENVREHFYGHQKVKKMPEEEVTMEQAEQERRTPSRQGPAKTDKFLREQKAAADKKLKESSKQRPLEITLPAGFKTTTAVKITSVEQEGTGRIGNKPSGVLAPQIPPGSKGEEEEEQEEGDEEETKVTVNRGASATAEDGEDDAATGADDQDPQTYGDFGVNPAGKGEEEAGGTCPTCGAPLKGDRNEEDEEEHRKSSVHQEALKAGKKEVFHNRTTTISTSMDSAHSFQQCEDAHPGMKHDDWVKSEQSTVKKLHGGNTKPASNTKETKPKVKITETEELKSAVAKLQQEVNDLKNPPPHKFEDAPADWIPLTQHQRELVRLDTERRKISESDKPKASEAPAKSPDHKTVEVHSSTSTNIATPPMQSKATLNSMERAKQIYETTYLQTHDKDAALKAARSGLYTEAFEDIKKFRGAA